MEYKLSYRAAFLWANLPSEYKTANSLNEFQPKIKELRAETYPCRLLKKCHKKSWTRLKNLIPQNVKISIPV